MRRLKLVIIFAASAMFFTVGCGGEPDSSDSSSDAEASPTDVETVESIETTAEREPAGNPCVGTRGPCEVVASVDVDGDGNADNVGIELVDGLVSVHIDTGGLVYTASVDDKHILRTDITPSNVFVGAFHITREQGADIVVDGKFGLGAAELFGVIGWDDGPVVVPAPPGTVYPESLPTEWAIPTERLRVLVRCPEPGSVGVITTEGDVSYGIPTPGGAYTETITSNWRDGAWTLADTTRVAGEYESSNNVAKTGTFECDPVHDAPPDFAPTASDLDPTLTLGGQPISNSQGYGQSMPPIVYFGGSPSGYIGDIVWETWGGERAVGHGIAPYVTPTGTVADAELTPAEIVAYDISVCDGIRAYSKVQWYFPTMGQTFDATLGSNVC